jgi:hypothetical protein
MFGALLMDSELLVIHNLFRFSGKDIRLSGLFFAIFKTLCLFNEVKFCCQLLLITHENKFFSLSAYPSEGVWQTIFPEIRNFRPCNFNRLADYSDFPDCYSGKPDSSCGVWIISARDWESGPVNGKKGDKKKGTELFSSMKKKGTELLCGRARSCSPAGVKPAPEGRPTTG